MMESIKKKVKSLLTDPLKRSMLLNTLCKPTGMIISFLYTPILLAYLGEEAYGLWSTILSVINWMTYFDVGIGQGLRNSLSKYIAQGDEKAAKESVSTGYVALSAISGITFLFGTLLIITANLNRWFNTEIPLRAVLLISFSSICITFILSLSKAQLYATQQAEKVGFMTVLTHMLNLTGVLILSVFSKGSLLGVAVVIGLSGIIVNLIFTQKVWGEYPYLIPNLRSYRTSELSGICNVGIKFFFIQIAALVLYSTDNMIITQLFGPSYVTPYHTSYTAFGIVNGLFGAMIAPLWSKYTVAAENKDYAWIKKTVINLDKLLPLIGAVLFVGTFCFEPVSRIWLHKTLEYTPGLIACMAAYYFFNVWGSIYATVMNGMNKVDMQLILGVASALINIPLSIFLGKNCGLGTTGVCLATVICMLVTNVPITISVHRYLSKKIAESR